jgi:putative endonuclease
MYFVYILQSEKDNRYYVGTTANIERRLKEHNTGSVKSTTAYRPWTLKRLEEFPDISAAYKRERFIKAKRSRKIIKKIIAS